MKHEIDAAKFGPLGPAMAEAVQTCVHCGFCLPACPTYQVFGQEMDTPRGRIVLMKDVLEGKMELQKAMPHVDRCLGCLACETACPSGVKYRELISPFRQMAEGEKSATLGERFKKTILLQTLPHPGRFRIAAMLGKFARPFSGILPRSMRPMLDLLPDKLQSRHSLPERAGPEGKPRARVALLAGCAQQVLAPNINRATIDLLVRAGVEVVIPKSQVCCGALAWHVGAGDEARNSARKNLTAFPRDVDAILTNAAGCGSGLHEYPIMLKGQPEEDAARVFAGKVQDVCSFLDQLGMPPPPPTKSPVVIAYHDACHLSHAQGVRSAPRQLLRRIPGVELREISDGDICCGSAGTYNIDQPETAAILGKKKAENILATGAQWLAAGNIGCLSQISLHLRQAPKAPRLAHTVEILQLAYEGKL